MPGKRWFPVWAASLISLLTLAAPAGAQVGARAEPTLGGFWISAKYGLGWSRVDCPACATMPADGDPWRSSYGYATGLAVGGTPRPNLEVGGEFAYFRSFREEGRIAEISSAGAIARWYPRAESPLNVRGGIGIGTLDLSDAAFEPARRVSVQALKLRLGAGYDVPIGRSFALVPALGATALMTGGAEARWPFYVHFTLALTRY
jgi:hypothetical protein